MLFTAEKLSSIEDSRLDDIGCQLVHGLKLPANADLAIDFPAVVGAYSKNPVAESRLKKSKGLCIPGRSEQFIIWAGDVVAGMSTIVRFNSVPSNVPPDTPSSSGFVFNPWRRKGAGLFTLEVHLDESAANFNGGIWTAVRKTNSASQGLSAKAGFVPVDENWSVFEEGDSIAFYCPPEGNRP
ncbi:MAG TPA: hypothetical protein VLG37_02650 [Candidatus Saccharimonadales bacterium]|nr:hypothetical protein [Candidatus Saccharimonadales bacterium]